MSMQETSPGTTPPMGGFVPTRWTLVLRAQGATAESRAALSDLCASYYEPVRRFLQREGRDEDAARELAQEFFAGVLARGGLGVADPGKGLFRTYLLGAVKHFLFDQRKHAARAKRGAGAVPESLDAVGEDGEEPTLQVADTSEGMGDAWFDRDWALTLMARALDALAEQFRSEGKAVLYEALEPWLVGDVGGATQLDVGQRLGMSESAVKVAVHRLRKRFREILKAEIAQTLPEGGDPAAELGYLAEVLVRVGRG
jgi:RNA polymerase sigma-70 factor (ECF subfamily)